MAEELNLQDQLKILYDLQKVDDEVAELKKEAELIPLNVSELNNEIEMKEQVVQRKKQGLKNLTGERKEKEHELEIIEIRIANDKTKLMAVKSNKEYHALQQEINNHEEASGVLEEEILLMMDDIEQFDVETRKLASRFNSQKKEIQSKINEFESRLSQIPVAMEGKTCTRNDLASGVQRELMERYEATKKQREGQAVAFVENGICMGCHMGIPPQLFNQIQRNEEVFTCPNCYRILYFPGIATINEIDL